MKDEPAAGRNDPIHRQILNFTYVPPRSTARERLDFLVKGSDNIVDIERVAGGDHGR